MPNLLVTDANILIDLGDTNNHQVLFLEGTSVYTTHEVMGELLGVQAPGWQPYITAGRLSVVEADEATTARIRQEAAQRLSDVDCTVLALAIDKTAILVSGDQLIVKHYRRQGHEAHGILWLLDQHEAARTLVESELYHILGSIMAINSWLPARECNRRMRRWGEVKDES